MRKPFRRERSVSQVEVPAADKDAHRQAERAVHEAQAAAERTATLLPQMAALRERLRSMRAENHFSERINEMLQQGYGSARPNQGPR